MYEKNLMLEPVKGVEYPRYYSRLMMNLFRRQKLLVPNSGCRALLNFRSVVSDEQGEPIVAQKDTMILCNLKK